MLSYTWVPSKFWPCYRKGFFFFFSLLIHLHLPHCQTFFLIYFSDLFIWLLLQISFPARWAAYGAFNISVSSLSLWVFCTSASVIITVIALYFYKAFAYLIYLAYCSINDLVTVSLKVLHYKLEIKKKKVLPF